MFVVASVSCNFTNGVCGYKIENKLLSFFEAQYIRLPGKLFIVIVNFHNLNLYSISNCLELNRNVLKLTTEIGTDGNMVQIISPDIAPSSNDKCLSFNMYGKDGASHDYVISVEIYGKKSGSLTK